MFTEKIKKKFNKTFLKVIGETWNDINYISKNISKENKPIDLYKDYIKSIAIQKSNLSCNSVVNKLENWIVKTFTNNTRKDVCIVCNNEKEWISI